MTKTKNYKKFDRVRRNMVEVFIDLKDREEQEQGFPSYMTSGRHPEIRGHIGIQNRQIRKKKDEFRAYRKAYLRAYYDAYPKAYREAEHKICSETEIQKQALLIQEAAQGLVEMGTDTGQYHYSCSDECVVLTNYPWSKYLKKGRFCQQCYGQFRITRASTRRSRVKIVKRTTDSCALCKYQYCSDEDFECHAILGECAKFREKCVIV